MFARRTQTVVFTVLLFSTIKCQSISDWVNSFTLDLLAETSREPGSPKNLALSPYTVWTLLSILNEGAQDETARQIQNALHIPNVQKDEFRQQFRNFSSILQAKGQGSTFDTYNAVFTTIQQKLKPRYRNMVQNLYNVNVQPTDFSNQKSASDKINKFIEQATRNRIQNFVRPDDLTYAQIFVVSALYFKGLWQNPFKRNQTRRATFYDEKKNELGQVDMMYQMGFFPYARLSWISSFSVELPYGKDGKTSMILILPNKGETLQGILEKMKSHDFHRVIDELNQMKMKFEDEDVQVYLPKFKVESDLTLNSVLQKLGVVDLFDAARANLLEMFPHYLYVTRLLQRAEIEVNEEGTVASAASGSELINKIPPPKFQANRPFLYFIVNKSSKSIIFAGKITVPPK